MKKRNKEKFEVELPPAFYDDQKSESSSSSGYDETVLKTVEQVNEQMIKNTSKKFDVDAYGGINSNSILNKVNPRQSLDVRKIMQIKKRNFGNELVSPDLTVKKEIQSATVEAKLGALISMAEIEENDERESSSPTSRSKSKNTQSLLTNNLNFDGLENKASVVTLGQMIGGNQLQSQIASIITSNQPQAKKEPESKNVTIIVN